MRKREQKLVACHQSLGFGALESAGSFIHEINDLFYDTWEA